MTPEQVALFKAMPPLEKLAVAARFQIASRELKAASLRALRPGTSEHDIQKRTLEFFLYAAD